MSGAAAAPRVPTDRRASIAVDLGAESCRISLLRWRDGRPEITLVHRFPNGPVERDGHHFWPLQQIEQGLDDGLRRCAALAPEGIRSLAVDGWAVDYVRLDAANHPLSDPFCYRDERTVAAFDRLHQRISADRLGQITGIQIARINTLYQLVADAAMNLPPGVRWLNLPEYILTRWGAEPFAEYTNATHTGLIDIHTRTWSPEIFSAAGLDITKAPRLVPPGTILGKLRGPLAELPALRDTLLIAPACHDTASAIAGIAAPGVDWAYISSGTWSLIGTLLDQPCTTPDALHEGFTNLGAVGGRTCCHISVNGMWLLKQCMDAWQGAGSPWTLEDLIAAAAREPAPAHLLDVADPELGLVGDMPGRINCQRRQRDLPPIDESPAAAPQLAALIFHSLAAEYATVLARLEHHTGHTLPRIVIVGGGGRNELLSNLTATYTGRTVLRGSAESSTLGNFAVQLATLDRPGLGTPLTSQEVSSWASGLS